MADPDCFTLKLLLLPSGKRFLKVTQLYTELINFIVLLHLRGGLPFDFPDNRFHHLLLLPAVWTLPGHDFEVFVCLTTLLHHWASGLYLM